MIEISENAIPRVIDGVAVVQGKKDGQKVYVARRGSESGWGLTPEEALKALG